MSFPCEVEAVKRDVESLKRDFVCCKCRGRCCAIEEVALPSGPFSRVLPMTGTPYHAVTCTLCGYTEFFNLEAVAHEKEAVRGKGGLTEGTENA